MRGFLLVLTMVLAAQSQQPQPYDVNGVKLGSTFSDWKRGAGANCEKWQPVEPGVMSYVCLDTAYAGAPVQQTVNFYQGQLLSFYLIASHSDFESLRSALKQKFGKPERTVQQALALDGVTRQVEVNRWSNGITSLNLVEYSPDKDHTVIFLSHIGLMADKTKNSKGPTGGM
jgi:hypothetical protein